MIHLCLDSPPGDAETMLSGLRGYQAEVDAYASYSDRVNAANVLWTGKRQNKPLKIAQDLLVRMCPGPNYCMFCEDSRASDIEHLRPKTLFPELVFAWANFLYACTLCNRGKGSAFKVYRGDGAILDVTRRRGMQVVAPAAGEALFIDPRHEDPLELIHLDLATGIFDELHKTGLNFERAKFTIDQLGLNKRDYLISARSDTYHENVKLLGAVVEMIREGATGGDLELKKRALHRRPHRTVWLEMKRQRCRIDSLRRLFTQAPDTLNW